MPRLARVRFSLRILAKSRLEESKVPIGWRYSGYGGIWEGARPSGWLGKHLRRLEPSKRAAGSGSWTAKNIAERRS